MKEIKVGLIGFGTVGKGVATILIEQIEQNTKRLGGLKVILKKIVDKKIPNKTETKIKQDIFTTNISDVLDDPEISIVIEAIGGTNPALSYILSAIKSSKNVVTSNKEVIAKHYEEITDLAKQNQVNVFFEAAVGGGIPILRPINKCLTGNKINSLYGIVNGTTNFILSKMTSENKDFLETLKEAQLAGYAEADPSADVDGFDAQYKAKILTALAYGLDIDLADIYREGIRKISAVDIKYAKELNYVIKLLAIAESIDDNISVRVHPVMLKRNNQIAKVDDAYNAIVINGNNVGELMFYGSGAGMMPTASAVVADVFDLAIDSKYRMRETLKPSVQPISINKIKNCYYLRLNVENKPGVLSKITNIFGQNNVSITTVLQQPTIEKDAQLIIITELVSEDLFQKAIKEIENANSVNKLENFIRVGVQNDKTEI